jgi:dTDP-glucose pyrophosphorylase
MNTDTQKLKQKCVEQDTTVHEAIHRLENGRQKLLLVLDSDGKLLGTISDGDIRRAIISGVSLEKPVTECMHLEPVCVPEDTPVERVIAFMYGRALKEIPIVDADGRPVAVHMVDDLLDKRRRDNVAFVVAGGHGLRLRPHTKKTPKPLLVVGGKPILESIVLKLIAHGFHKFIFSVNYKKEMIKEHFGNGENYGIEIDYVEEETPLGTAGSIGLVKNRPRDPFLIINSDIITNLNFGDMLKHHEQSQAGLTVGTVLHEIEIPFGVVELDSDSRITSIAEKPVQSYQVCGGVYVMQPELLDHIPRGTRLDMPDLIELLVDRGDVVKGYDIIEYWNDVGHSAHIDRAEKDFILWGD